MLIVSQAVARAAQAAPREPRRPQPARLSRLRRLLGRAQHRRAQGRGRRHAGRDPAGRQDRAARGADRGAQGGRAGMSARTLRLWRGDATGGESRRLRARGRIRDGGARRRAGDPAQRRAGPGRALELQGGQVRLLQRRGERPAAADVQDAAGSPAGGRTDHGRAAAGVPDHPRSRHRRQLELRGEQADPPVHAQARRGVGDRSGGRRPDQRVPEVHRVLPLPGRLPRPA